MKSVIEQIKYSANSEVTNLLWTGGWDSTFRLLQLLFIEEKVVKPHYIIDAQECTGKEIDTMHNIRRKILCEYPKKRKLLLPISFTDIGEINKNEAITEEYKEITKSVKLNYQYEFLARYCHQINVSSMELSIYSDGKMDRFIDDTIIFSYFKFPVFNLTKTKMVEIAEKEGWTKIMKLTWFCRRPKNSHPCGFCGPCTDAVIEGMGWRLPLRIRIIATIELPFRKWWRNNYQKQNKGVLKYVRLLLKGRV